jgi:hypothetical protein
MYASTNGTEIETQLMTLRVKNDDDEFAIVKELAGSMIER